MLLPESPHRHQSRAHSLRVRVNPESEPLRLTTTDSQSLAIDAMLFDLDDTLIDRRAAFESWASWTAPIWLNAPPDSPEVRETVSWMKEIDAEGFTPREEFFRLVTSRVSGLTRNLDDLVGSYYRDILRFVRLNNGAFSVLNELEHMGVPFGIVTNGFPHQRDKAAAVGLTDRCACFVISCECTAAKPAPEIFTHAARRLGVASSDIGFVGDQPEIDICGAHRAGMRTIWLTDGREWPVHLPHECCDLSMDSLEQLVLD